MFADILTDPLCTEYRLKCYQILLVSSGMCMYSSHQLRQERHLTSVLDRRVRKEIVGSQDHPDKYYLQSVNRL